MYVSWQGYPTGGKMATTDRNTTDRNTTDRNTTDRNISTRTPAAPPAVTLNESLATLRRAAAATDELLAAMSDNQDIVPVPGLAWTVSETAAHLVTLLTSSAAYASGARDGAAERAALPSHGG